MGITGLLPFLEKASRRANVSEFSGCTVAIDSYCWLHKGAFACAEKLVRGEDTDIHIKYCIKYVTMLLSKNIKPILVFDGRHLPAKAMTEAKRRESRNISKKRAAELLSLGKIEEARSYMRRSVDITHKMALNLIKECRRRNVDCIVAPYEADAQLAYLNMKNIAQLVISEDSDLVLFGCTKVLFKMDLDGSGTLVETTKIPLVMRCPIERYTFDKFRQMCIMSGCDYLASLPGIGLAKARQFITATQDSNIANALKKLPSFFNKSQLVVTDEYREGFLQAEATFKHQYVYNPLNREMVRLTETDDDDTEAGLCCNAGEMLSPRVAFQLALGNLDPFTLKEMDDWNPDDIKVNNNIKTDGWKQSGISPHPSIWTKEFHIYLGEQCPWQKKSPKKEQPFMLPVTRPRKVVNLVTKFIAETQDDSLSIENLSNMYCVEPANKKLKMDKINSQDDLPVHDVAMTEDEISPNLTQSQPKSPILGKSYKRNLNITSFKKLSKFPRTTLDDSVVESKFFNIPPSSVNKSNSIDNSEINDQITNNNVKSPILQTPEHKLSRNPFKAKQIENQICNQEVISNVDNIIIIDSEDMLSSQKENSPSKVRKSPLLELSIEHELNEDLNKNTQMEFSQVSVIENTYPMEMLVTPVDSQDSFGTSPSNLNEGWRSKYDKAQDQPPPPVSRLNSALVKKSNCRVSGLRKTSKLSLPSNQPTLLSKFGFQKKPIMKK